MATEDLWKQIKKPESKPAPEQGNNEPRYSDTLEQIEQAKYEKRYRRIRDMIKTETLDFQKIAESSQLKERKIRDTLLYRLTTDNMIQLFGRKEGICYVCGLKMRGTYTQEPLCLVCLESIDLAIDDIQAERGEEASAKGVEELPQATPTDEYTNLKAQYDMLLMEVTQYREQYGPLESFRADTEAPCATAESKESKDMPATLLAFLGSDDDEDEPPPGDLPDSTSAPTSSQSFGFQRLSSRK